MTQTKNPILRFFAYDHLPIPQREISKVLADAAAVLDESIAESAEKSAGMRKLLEAKDCFVRASLPLPN